MSVSPMNLSQGDVFVNTSGNIILNLWNGSLPSDIVNSTVLTREQLKQVEYVSFVLYLVSFIVGAPANLYVLIGMIRNTLKIKQEIRMLLIHLAIADSSVVFIFVPTEFIWKLTGEWLADEFTCKFLSIFRTFGLFASSFILIAISLDRYFAIKDPLENIDSEKRIKIMLSVCWIMASILSLPQVSSRTNYILSFIDIHTLTPPCTQLNSGFISFAMFRFQFHYNCNTSNLWWQLLLFRYQQHSWYVPNPHI